MPPSTLATPTTMSPSHHWARPMRPRKLVSSRRKLAIGRSAFHPLAGERLFTGGDGRCAARILHVGLDECDLLPDLLAQGGAKALDVADGVDDCGVVDFLAVDGGALARQRKHLGAVAQV